MSALPTHIVRVELTVISHLPALKVISGWIDMVVYVYVEATEAMAGVWSLPMTMRQHDAAAEVLRAHGPTEMR